MTLTDAASLLGRLETVGIPVGFTLLTIVLQALFGTFSAKTLGADLAAAAASLHISTILTRVNVAHSIGASTVIQIITLVLGVVWCICLRLAGPPLRLAASPLAPAPRAGLPHVASFLLGLLALYVASWVAVALQAAQTTLKVAS
jgi:hypothetical protein